MRICLKLLSYEAAQTKLFLHCALILSVTTEKKRYLVLHLRFLNWTIAFNTKKLYSHDLIARSPNKKYSTGCKSPKNTRCNFIINLITLEIFFQVEWNKEDVIFFNTFRLYNECPLAIFLALNKNWIIFYR